MRYYPLLLLFFPLVAGAASELPPELKAFLGAPPAAFEKNFGKPAKDLRAALDKLGSGKKDQAIKDLSRLSEKGEMAEHASYELAVALRDKKQFAKSTSLALRVAYEFPSTPYRTSLEDLIGKNDCDQGLAESKTAKGPEKSAQAAALLQRCLQRTPWRDWKDRENQIQALYEIFKSRKDPLLGPLIAEMIQALPPSSPLRVKLQKEVPDTELRTYANVARFRTKSSPPPGIKAIYPDQELFDKGMIEVLEGKWSSANELFKQVVSEFPNSQHQDRAHYWIARSEQALGNEEEAKSRYEQIYTDSPLSYYGLQSALRLKRDLSSFIVPAESTPESFKGSLFPRQALAVWRIRAMLESGLVDQARTEAKTLFSFKPGGFTFGQENPSGAALAALLFHTAGYSLAAFSHAYAAVSLEPKLLNTFTLDLIFPGSFQKQFDAAAELTGVHPLLLLSVAKQESAFIPDAISRANALGLMQLLLSTARDLEPKLSRDQLFDPAVNTKLGSRYLQKLLERFQGNIALALAGYNAGPSRASQWQKRMNEYEGMRKSFDIDTFIDTIPFAETRGYVASILRNYAWYKLLNKDGRIGSVEELAFQWQKNKTENLTAPAQPIDPPKTNLDTEPAPVLLSPDSPTVEPETL